MFKCSLCVRGFSRGDAMKRHLRTVHRTCPSCMVKLTLDGGDHVCSHKSQLKNLNTEVITTKNENSQQGFGVNNIMLRPHAKDDTDSEEEEDSGDEEHGMEEGIHGDDKHSENKSPQGCYLHSSDQEESDVFAADDEEMETDATISSSEDEKEDEEDEEETCDEEEVEKEKGNSTCDTIFLEWPDTEYYLKTRWHKYGSGAFKIIEHRHWLGDFIGMSKASILRRVRRATQGEFRAMCEIAKNILLGNVFVRKVDKTFLRKNKNLIRALANPRISIQRKKDLVLERGAYFVEGLVQIMNPLICELEDEEHSESDTDQSA